MKFCYLSFVLIGIIIAMIIPGILHYISFEPYTEHLICCGC